MAITGTPKITPPKLGTTSSINSPYYYGGGGIASTMASQQPSKPITNPLGSAQTARNTTGYPMTSIGGGPTQDPFGTQTLGSIPWKPTGDPGSPANAGSMDDVPNPNSPVNVQKAMTDYLSNDAIRVAQIQALNAGLSSNWATGVLSPAQQYELQFGGVPRDALGNLMTDSMFGAGPTGFAAGFDPTTGAMAAAPSLGQSLGSALLDPTNVANAQSNKFSALAQIARQLQGKNAASLASYGAYGNSGAIAQAQAGNQMQADQATQDAANTFLGNLNTLYGNFLGNLQTAGGQWGQYNQDAYDRMMSLIQVGAIDPFGTNAAKAAAAAKARTSTPVGPGSDGSDYIPYSDPAPEGWMDPGTTYTINQPTPPTYGITTGPPAGQRASSNKKQGVYTIH